MYYDYRSFIKTKILAVCPDFKEHKDGFNRDNIDSVTAKDGFHILPGRINREFVTHQCDDYEDTLNLNLWLVFCGGIYVQAEIDEAIDKANCIANELMKREQYPIDDTLVRTLVNNFEPIPMDTNDNIIIISMNIQMLIRSCTDSCA